MNFFEWLDKKDLLINLYLYLLDADSDSKGIYNDENYHNNLVRKLRVLGLGDYANELEIIKISDEEIEFSKNPIDSSTKNYYKKRESSRLAYNTYMNHIEYLIKEIHHMIKKFGYLEDLEKEFDKKIKKYPEFEDYNNYYGI